MQVRIWNLADIDKNGFLDAYEFALAKHFLEMKLNGFELPPFLPACLKPDSQRKKTDDTSSIAEEVLFSSISADISSDSSPKQII